MILASPKLQPGHGRNEARAAARVV